VSNPAIVMISADHADVLEEQFWRYSREYDVRVARSAREAKHLVMDLHKSGAQVCLFVAGSRLPDADVPLALASPWRWRPCGRWSPPPDGSPHQCRRLLAGGRRGR